MPSENADEDGAGDNAGASVSFSLPFGEGWAASSQTGLVGSDDPAAGEASGADGYCSSQRIG